MEDNDTTVETATDETETKPEYIPLSEDDYNNFVANYLGDIKGTSPVPEFFMEDEAVALVFSRSGPKSSFKKVHNASIPSLMKSVSLVANCFAHRALVDNCEFIYLMNVVTMFNPRENKDFFVVADYIFSHKRYMKQLTEGEFIDPKSEGVHFSGTTTKGLFKFEDLELIKELNPDFYPTALRIFERDNKEDNVKEVSE